MILSARARVVWRPVLTQRMVQPDVICESDTVLSDTVPLPGEHRVELVATFLPRCLPARADNVQHALMRVMSACAGGMRCLVLIQGIVRPVEAVSKHLPHLPSPTTSRSRNPSPK
eukprot:3933683-Rhodomonas_salina.1